MKPTHQEQFLSILAEAGISTAESSGNAEWDKDETFSIVRIENVGNVGGYRDFFTEWFFRQDGSLRGVANWE